MTRPAVATGSAPWLLAAALVSASLVTPTSPAVASGQQPPDGDRAEQAAEALAELPDRGPVRVVVVQETAGDRPDVAVVPSSDPEEAAAAIESARRDPDVVAIELDHRVRALDHPPSTDPLRPYQWGMSRLDAEHLWGATRGGGVTVAVVDSGVDGKHADLRPALVPGVDYVAGGDGTVDPNGHGTHVAGAVVAVPENRAGVIGLAPEAVVMPMRVLDSSGGGYASDVAQAIVDATDRGARVVNLSLGGPENSAAVAAAVDYALSRGVVVVAAAGNQRLSGNPTTYPAALPGVIAVAASTSNDVSASFSNTGPYVALTAPGQSVLSTVPGGDWQYSSGTSMATPHVSAAAAAVLALAPQMTPADVRFLLMSTAEDLEQAGYDEATGAGLVDPVAAVESLRAPIAPPPPPPAPAPTVVPGLPRDWNGDRAADLLAADSGGTLYLYAGNGTGGFSGRKAIGSGWGARDSLTVTGDWDGDRRPDLVARNPATGELWLYAGNGTGGFLRARVIGTGWNGFDRILSPSDWNGDGRVDLVARRSDGGLFLYPGNGSGGFGRATQIGWGWQGLDMLTVAGDWDADGKPDLLARDGAGQLLLYSGSGTGRFAGSRVVGTGWDVVRTLTGPGDWDGDRRPDLVAVLDDGTMRLYPSNGYGGFGRARQIGTGWGPYRLAF